AIGIGRERAVVAGRRGQRHHALVEAGAVDGQRPVARARVLLLAVAVALAADLVLLRRPGRRAVGGQRRGVDAGGVVVEVVELVGTEGQVEVAVREEVQEAALRVPGRRRLAGLVGGELAGAALFQAVEPDRAVDALAGLDVGQPAAVRRPGVVGQVFLRTVVGDGDPAAGHVDDVEPLALVAEGQLLRIRRPHRLEAPDLAATGDLARGA